MKKSSLVVFILSFIPGLSHLYLGLPKRALIFMLTFFGATIGIGGLTVLTHTEELIILLLGFMGTLWLVALIDAFSAREKMVYRQEGEVSSYRDTEYVFNRKIITMMLSIIPGAGHMYMGLLTKGVVFMSTFFFVIFFMGWLNSSLFLFVLPVLWFYSFFDAFHTVGGGEVKIQEFDFSLLKINHKWIGWGLIGIGIFIVLERMIYPLIPWQFQRHIQTSVVAMILIGGGIKLVMGKKDEKQEEIDLWEKEE